MILGPRAIDERVDEIHDELLFTRIAAERNRDRIGLTRFNRALDTEFDVGNIGRKVGRLEC